MDTTEKKTIRQVAEEVAACLGPDWRVEAPKVNAEYPEWNDNDANVVSRGRYRLYFHNQYRDKNRIHICAEFPKLRDGEEIPKARRPYGSTAPWHAISVAHDKAPRKIAADIVNRLLPDYIALIPEVLAQKAEIEGIYDRRIENAEAVCKVLDGKLRKGQRDSDEVTVSTAYVSGACSSDIKFKYSGGMDIKIETSDIHLAKAIAALVKAERAAAVAEDDAILKEIETL